MAARQGQARHALIIFAAMVSVILVLAGLVAGIVAWAWTASGPRCSAVEFVATAKLSDFNLSNTTLRYNLTVNVTIRNPNPEMGIYYDHVEARAYYHDQRLDAVNLATSYQQPKTTAVLAAAFHGQRQFLLLGPHFERDKASGVYGIEVRLYLSVRFRFGKRETGLFDPQLLDFPFDLDLPIAADQQRCSPTASYSYINVDKILALDH